jgi:hypothetical protein
MPLGALIMPKRFYEIDRIARDEHSCLLQKILTYDCKKFYIIGPRWLQTSAHSTYTLLALPTNIRLG